MVDRVNLFDVGSKYGKVGSGIGNLVKAGADVYVDNQNKAKIDEITKKYNDPMAMEFQGMSPSEKASKMSRLLYPLDPQMSQRYEQIANTERVKEASQKREDEQNASIATAFEQPKTAYDTQKKTYETDKAKFLADKVNWDTTATTIDGLKEELAKAENDLMLLRSYQEHAGMSTEPNSELDLRTQFTPQTSTLVTPQDTMSRYNRPAMIQPKENR